MFYQTLFKPSFNIPDGNNFFLFSNIRSNSEIVSKNFLTLIYYLKYNENSKTPCSILIRKKNKKNMTILRAPYRYKIARYQLYVANYKVVVTMSFQLNTLSFCNVVGLIFFIKTVSQNIGWFDSNIITQVKSQVSFGAYYKNNFLFLNYQNS
jgi:hypothetical protein